MSSPLSTVLVVDDDPMLRYLLARTLADMGYPVIAVENGEQALILEHVGRMLPILQHQ